MMIWQQLKSFSRINMVDYFKQSTNSLRNKRLFLFDMDGTIYEENNVFEGTHQLLEYIKSIGGNYIFITNNSSKSVKDYVNKLNRLGIESTEDNFFTSAQATVLYLNNYFPNSKVYCQGTASFLSELKESGVDVTEECETVDVVCVGFDTELNTKKINRTCEILATQDAFFIATNPDLRCPVRFGFIPDCGSICQMIENATSKKPIYIGKPEPTMVNIVRERLGYTADETVVIGDRLYTDIATGLNAGVTAICVLTGEATVDDIMKGKIKPSFTFKSVRELFLCLLAENIDDINIKKMIENRSLRMPEDIKKCKDAMDSNDDNLMNMVISELRKKYILDIDDGKSMQEQIASIIEQLHFAIRFL